jgi:hypothetical protein
LEWLSIGSVRDGKKFITKGSRKAAGSLQILGSEKNCGTFANVACQHARYPLTCVGFARDTH